MAREILTKKIENGWSSKDGRVRAIRDTSLLEDKKNGAVFMNVSRFTYWTVELLDAKGNVIDDDSVDVLAEAEDVAWWFQCRIDEGRA